MKLTDVKKKGELQVRDPPEVQRVSTLDRYFLLADEETT
jgi:hypothetical protein